MILAIDPGSTESAYVIVDRDAVPIVHGKVMNRWLLDNLPELALPATHVAIEMVASYGMAVGADVFETVLWTGRFYERLERVDQPAELVYRRAVKLHHCGTSKAKDANITQALIDRFASGEPNRGKGTKAAPGFFYGFKADIWQAFALAVYAADTRVPS